MLRIALLFVVLIVYGSLYPFAVWITPQAPLGDFLLSWPSRIDRADVVQNVLAYAPLGLFLSLWRLPALGARAAITRTVAASLLLSLTMEWLQQFEPARTASIADIALNMLGALAGAVLALLFAAPRARGPALVRLLQGTRRRWFQRGTLPNLGLAALALWALAETSPLAPALDATLVLRKLGWLLWEVRHPDELNLALALVAACQLSALAMLVATLMRVPAPAHAPAATVVLLALLAAVFAAKLVIHGRMLVVEQVVGALIALGTLRLARGAPARAMATWGAAMLLAGFVVGELLPGEGRVSWQFNWVPLAGQLRSLSGLENILELFWPFFALAYFARLASTPARREAICWLGGLLVLALVFRLEWMQTALPGRYGDITQVLLALGGWLMPWSFRSPDHVVDRLTSATDVPDTAPAPMAARNEAVGETCAHER